jgi:phenylacetic acid degradation operon negative regulatory protein
MIQEGKGTMTARSVLASALLGEEPPELPVAHLVHLAGLFGINENRSRVALSRMVAHGEATTDGAGRYRLTGHLLERQDRQTLSRRGVTGPWGGGWCIAVVTATGAAAEDRSARRKRLGRARLAEQREGVWVRPDNIPLVPDPADDDGVSLFRGTPDGDPAGLAGRLWDLEGWAAAARYLMGLLEVSRPGAPADLADGFVLSASVLRHLQADPLLPEELLPADWPGRALRRRYEVWDRGYRQVLRSWSRGAGDRSRPENPRPTGRMSRERDGDRS